MNDNLFDIIKASELAARTENAYMADVYGKKEWIECILFMAEKGLDEDDIECVLRSKHMRWASGSYAGKERTAYGFELYWDQNKNGIQNDLHVEHALFAAIK